MPRRRGLFGGSFAQWFPRDEEPNLNPSAPSVQPGTRGMFGRRPTGMPLGDFSEVAPLAPAWATTRPQGFEPEDRNAASFTSFPDYANAAHGLRSEPIDRFAGGAPAGRGVEPPSAPSAPFSQGEADNQAWNEALSRARGAIAEEGVPYMADPTWVESRTEMDRALDRDRAARAERAHREGVSFDEWWRFGGGVAGPDNGGPAYRFTRLPRREEQWATSRRR